MHANFAEAFRIKYGGLQIKKSLSPLEERLIKLGDKLYLENIHNTKEVLKNGI